MPRSIVFISPLKVVGNSLKLNVESVWSQKSYGAVPPTLLGGLTTPPNHPADFPPLPLVEFYTCGIKIDSFLIHFISVFLQVFFFKKQPYLKVSTILLQELANN